MKKKTPPPVKRSRDPEKSRKEILDVAFTEVFQRGFQGVSVDDIVKQTSLTKGAFYHQFPTKLDLGYALVEEVIVPMILTRWILPLEKYDNPVEGILKQIHTLIGRSAPEHLRLGCPLNNLVQEMAPVDEGFRKRLQAGLQLWVDETAKHLKRAQDAGYIRKEINVKHAAYFTVMAHEGFYGMLKGLDPKTAFTALFESLKSYYRTIER